MKLQLLPLIFSALAISASKTAFAADRLLIKNGDCINVRMETPVSAEQSQTGDEFSVRTSEPFTLSEETTIPEGTLIRGRLATSESIEHRNFAKVMAFKFDSLVTASGAALPVQINLDYKDHAFTLQRDKQRKEVKFRVYTKQLPELHEYTISGRPSTLAWDRLNKPARKNKSRLESQSPLSARPVPIPILTAPKDEKLEIRAGDKFRIRFAEDLKQPQ